MLTLVKDMSVSFPMEEMQTAQLAKEPDPEPEAAAQKQVEYRMSKGKLHFLLCLPLFCLKQCRLVILNKMSVVHTHPQARHLSPQDCTIK